MIIIYKYEQVGLSSYMIHYQFQLVSGGYLDLLRRCTSLTCLGHCVCSSLGARCHPNGDFCSDVSAGMFTIKFIYDQIKKCFHILICLTVHIPDKTFTKIDFISICLFYISNFKFYNKLSNG